MTITGLPVIASTTIPCIEDVFPLYAG